VFFLLAAVEKRPGFLERHRAKAKILLLLTVFAMLGMAVSGISALTNRLPAKGEFILFVPLVYLAQSTLFINRFLRFTGEISYSIYISHFALVAAVKPLLLPVLSGLAPPTQLGLAWLLVFAGSAMLSWLSYRIIELPCIALGKRLTLGAHG